MLPLRSCLFGQSPFRGVVIGLVLILLGVAGLMPAAAQDEEAGPGSDTAAVPSEFQDLDVLRRGTEPPTTAGEPYASRDAALDGRRFDSRSVRSLNGDWRFHWAPDPQSRPADFYEPGYDVSDWNRIPVLSNWQMESYGTPIYLNSRYPFKVNPPRVMGTPPDSFTIHNARNPVGSYRRTFTIPDGWDDRRVFLQFEGADAALFLWVNGEQVGYSQGSSTLAVFEVTEHLQVGDNVVAAKVYRFSDGSCLEDQNMWRLSGLYRDGFLWSAGTEHVRDFFVRTDLDAQYEDAELQVDVDLTHFGATEGTYTVEAELLTPDSTDRVRTLTSEPQSVSDSTTLTLSGTVEDPDKWTVETPTLYLLLLTLRDWDGKVVEVRRANIGFREIEKADDRMLSNGEPVLLRGVNRHGHDPEMGHYVSRETMVEDLRLMKQNNVNAVRNSHYPMRAEWYELTDKYGLYVVDEANIESHYFGLWDENPLASDPDWHEAHLGRARRMVERYKNTPPWWPGRWEMRPAKEPPSRSCTTGPRSATPRASQSTATPTPSTPTPTAPPTRRSPRRSSTPTGTTKTRTGTSSTPTRWATAWATSRSTETPSSRTACSRAASSETGWTRASAARCRIASRARRPTPTSPTAATSSTCPMTATLSSTAL